MRFLELVDAVGDLPIQRLLIDIGEENAAREEAAVAVDIEQILGVEDDRLALLGGVSESETLRIRRAISSFSVSVSCRLIFAKEMRRRRSAVKVGRGELELLFTTGGDLVPRSRAWRRGGRGTCRRPARRDRNSTR